MCEEYIIYASFLSICVELQYLIDITPVPPLELGQLIKVAQLRVTGW